MVIKVLKVWDTKKYGIEENTGFDYAKLISLKRKMNA